MVAIAALYAMHDTLLLILALAACSATYLSQYIAGRLWRATDRVTHLLWLGGASLALGDSLVVLQLIALPIAGAEAATAWDVQNVAYNWAIAIATSAVFTTLTVRRSTTFASGALLSGATALGLTALLLTDFADLQIKFAPVPRSTGVGVFAIALAATVGAVTIGSITRRWRGRMRFVRRLLISVEFGGSLVLAQLVVLASHPAAATSRAINDPITFWWAGLLGLATVGFLLVSTYLTSLERRTATRAHALRSSLDQAKDELRFVTFNNTVTSLPNRLVFQDRLKQAQARCERNGHALAVLCIDVDNCGIDRDDLTRGDAVLRIIAARLMTIARLTDSLSHCERNRFIALVEDDRPADAATQLADRVAEAVREPIEVERGRYSVTTSIGIAVAEGASGRARLVVNASAAAEKACDAGGSCVRFYDARMDDEARIKRDYLNDLRLSIGRGELELHYQPKVYATTGKVAGVEALLRWKHPVHGWVGPGVFIPIAEQFGLMPEIGYWVIETACRQMRSWQDAGVAMRVAVNVSPRQLRDPALAERIQECLLRHGVDPDRLTCEITETVAMDDPAACLPTFRKLHGAGIQLSIDDFGTGYCSLAYLRQMPLRQIKIDRSFVADVDSSEDARAIVTAIVGLAHNLRLEVVAEGVETEAQRTFLRQAGCDKFQGYLFAKPMRAADLTHQLGALITRSPEPRLAFQESLVIVT